jgi:hypothetical protein
MTIFGKTMQFLVAAVLVFAVCSIAVTSGVGVYVITVAFDMPWK